MRFNDEDWSENKGPCAKQVVTATVIATDGKEFTSTNWCERPQKVCPRLDYPTGKGYHLCVDICKQRAHAEINAMDLAADYCQGATIMLKGHYYACDPCQDEAKRREIKEIILVEV